MGKVNNALRMLAILGSREKVTRKELADELEVSIREISRYKEDLEYAGVTIHEIRGRYGGYFIDNNDYLLNLNISKNEQFALDNALEQLKNVEGCFYKDLCSVVEKIKAINPNNEQYIKSKVYSKGIKIKSDYEIERKKWLTINDAIINNRKIKIKYVNSNLKESTRIICPYGIFTYYGANYLVGRCETRDDIRQFKFIRICSIELLKEKFKSENFNLNQYLDNTIGIYTGEEYQMKLKVYYPYAQGFKEYQWVKNEKIDDYPKEGYLIYSAEVFGYVEVIPWIMGMGANCKVLEPVYLQEKIKEEYKKIMEQYD
ncbi:YafY family protein [uncultured Clostridium sp.]|uniref:helix-turn-helix transcriptional regulator n=1 Tax=uncultured Clostridium sp. TaxID=59620 RepID=UPI0025D49615|nr:transcriptional regulator [uncultured Clostridium sp.]